MTCQSCDKVCDKRTQNAQPEIIAWRFDYTKLMRWLVLASLVLAYWIGQSINQPNWLEQLQTLYPQSMITAVADQDAMWQITQGTGEHERTYNALITTENSYGGPLSLVTLYDGEGKVHAIEIVNHNDTPAYIQKLHNKRYFQQYLDKPVVRDERNKGFDAVSGATISSNAIMRAHFGALERGSKVSFDTTQSLVDRSIHLEKQHYIVMVFLALAVAAIWIKHPFFNTGLAVASLFLMGFSLNQMVSASYFPAFALGYTPLPSENFSFWLLLGGILAGIVILGRNIYCGNICPFGALQTLLAKITGLNFPVPVFIQRYGSYIPKIGLWIVMMIGLIAASPLAGSYEPFSMIFSFEGVGVQLAILPSVVIGSVFVPKIFCRYFCPAGQGLTYLTAGRNWLASLIKKKA